MCDEGSSIVASKSLWLKKHRVGLTGRREDYRCCCLEAPIANRDVRSYGTSRYYDIVDETPQQQCISWIRLSSEWLIDPPSNTGSKNAAPRQTDDSLQSAPPGQPRKNWTYRELYSTSIVQNMKSQHDLGNGCSANCRSTRLTWPHFSLQLIFLKENTNSTRVLPVQLPIYIETAAANGGVER